MKIRSIVSGMALLCSATFAFAQPAPIIIKFSHVTAVDTPKGAAAEYFKKLVDERSKGRVRIEVYPNSQLYKDKEELEALQMGAVQMLAPSLSKFGPLGVKEFEVFELPYLFEDTQSVHKLTRAPIGQQLLKKLEPKGIVGLAYWDNGMRQMTANRPLHAVSDWKGQKFRIVSAKVTDAYTRAMGAMPQVMAFSEIYQAMQSGVVDGGENALSNIYTQKFYEVQKHLTISNHGYLGYAVVINKKFWDSLPPDIRTLLEGALADATKYNDDIADKDNQRALEAIRKSGKTTIYTLTPEEKAAWKKQMLPVHQQVESRIGKELIQSVYKEIGFKAD
ncbi:MAG: DctP family TRAP transporter solute-binding subunit [Rhodocyclales bacterium GT-UBC]|nr:MAG: DctP family TRAP transporter solute-binding subunit [Rhodocyclales bacterium GT-UBC]